MEYNFYQFNFSRPDWKQTWNTLGQLSFLLMLSCISRRLKNIFKPSGNRHFIGRLSSPLKITRAINLGRFVFMYG